MNPKYSKIFGMIVLYIVYGCKITNSFWIIVHFALKSAELPSKSNAEGQREVERMFRAVGLDWAARGDVV